VYSWTVFSRDLQSMSELLGYEFDDGVLMTKIQALGETGNSAWELRLSDLDIFPKELSK
jgi:hypothetical protein